MPKGPKPRPIEERFWAKVDSSAGPEGCWPWTGYVMDNGYGRYQTNGTTWWTHRLAWTLTNGTIGEGLTIDHLCKVRICCNPAHLEPVSMRENILRSGATAAKNAAKTHCPQGHEYTLENTIIRRNGGRDCRACDNARSRRNYLANREKRNATSRAYYLANREKVNAYNAEWKRKRKAAG